MARSPGTDDDWKARSDASTLAEALEIQVDKKRFAAVQKAARERIDELSQIVQRHKVIAGSHKVMGSIPTVGTMQNPALP